MLLNKCPTRHGITLDQCHSLLRFWASNCCIPLTLFHSISIILSFDLRKCKWQPFFFFACRYLYFFEKGNPHITGAAIQSLIELITTEMQSDNSTPDPAADAFLSRTLGYIQFQKQKGGANGEKYDPIKVWHDNWMSRTTFMLLVRTWLLLTYSWSKVTSSCIHTGLRSFTRLTPVQFWNRVLIRLLSCNLLVFYSWSIKLTL